MTIIRVTDGEATTGSILASRTATIKPGPARRHRFGEITSERELLSQEV